MLVSKPWLKGFKGTTPEMERKVSRSLTAMLLSHDIHTYSRNLRRKLEYAVDLADTGSCLFTGYWRAGEFAKPTGEAVHASAYSNGRLNAGVVVFFNGLERDQDLAGTTLDLQRTIGARKPVELKRAYDLETREAVKLTLDGNQLKVAQPFPVAWHEYRLLALEAE
jgi:hypothetical protein